MHLKRIAAGVYETTDGSYRIAWTDQLFEGSRGAEHGGWEIRTLDSYSGWVIDDTCSSSTLREAKKRLAARIEREALR